MAGPADFRGIEPTRLVPSTLRGFRQFLFKYLADQQYVEGKRFGPIYQRLVVSSLNGAEWYEAKQTARCIPWSSAVTIHSDSEAPKKDCACGIYCLRFQDDWEVALWTPEIENTTGPFFGLTKLISGVVKSGGRVQFGSLGFRAQHAVIEAVHIPRPETRGDLALREYFKRAHPDVAVFSDREKMYEMFPADDFSSLYPADVWAKMQAEEQYFRAQNQAKRKWLANEGKTIIVKATGSFVPKGYQGKILDLP